MSNTTPTTLEEFIGKFEKPNFIASAPFYYETSTKTLNFGYGNNLTDAASGGAFRAWLSARGVTVSDKAWGYIQNPTNGNAGPSEGNLADWLNESLRQANNGTIVAGSPLSVSQPGLNVGTVATGVVNDRLSRDDFPDLIAKIPNFYDLPEGAQWAIADAHYNSVRGPSDLVGPKVIGYAQSGQMLSLATELAFRSSSVAANDRGAEMRNLARAVLALGGSPTLDGNKVITGVDFSGADIDTVVSFLRTANSGMVVRGSGTNAMSAQQYMEAWDAGRTGDNRIVTRSYSALKEAAQSFAHDHGLHVVDGNQQNIIDLSANVNLSTSLLSAINNGATTFFAGDVVRIPTGTVDLSIGQDTYLLNGEVGGRAATYFVVTDTDANGGTVRRLVQTGAKGPAEAGRITFLDATGHEVASFPTAQGEGAISLNVDGEVQYRVPAGGAGETMTYRQLSDGSVYSADDLGNWAVYKSAEQAAIDGDNVVVRAGDATGRLFIRTADGGGALWDGSEKRGDLIDWQDGYKDVRVEMAEGYYLLRAVNNGPEIVTSGADTWITWQRDGYATHTYLSADVQTKAYTFDNGIMAVEDMATGLVTVRRGEQADQIVSAAIFNPSQVAQEVLSQPVPVPVPASVWDRVAAEISAKIAEYALNAGELAAEISAKMAVYAQNAADLLSELKQMGEKVNIFPPANGAEVGDRALLIRNKNSAEDAILAFTGDGRMEVLTFTRDAGGSQGGNSVETRSVKLFSRDSGETDILPTDGSPGLIVRDGTQVGMVESGQGYLVRHVDGSAATYATIDATGSIVDARPITADTLSSLGRKLDFGNGTGVLLNAENRSLIATLAFQADGITAVDYGTDTWAYFRSDNSLAASIGYDAGLGEYYVSTASGDGGTGSFVLSGTAGQRPDFSNGMVTFAGPSVSVMIDAASGTGTYAIGGSVFTSGVGENVTLSDVSSSAPQISLGGITVTGNGSDGAIVSLGPVGESPVLSLAPGSSVAPATGGGYTVVAPSGEAWALGVERFKDEFAALTEWRLVPTKPDRPGQVERAA